jgi:hypothetical protein
MQQKDLLKRTYWYFGVFMAVMILIFGITLLATDVLYETIPSPNRKWIGIIFLIYAGFRGSRAFQQYRQFKSPSDDE